MNQSTSQINCPNCGQEIDVNEILYRQLDSELKKKYDEQITKERKGLEAEEKQLKAREEAIDKANEEYKQRLETDVKSSLKEERKKLEKTIKKKAQEEQEETLAALQNELQEKTNQVKELNKTKADIERLKREKEELKDKIELETQQKLSETLAEEKEKIKKAEAEKAQLNISEKEQVINQLKEQLLEAQRKAEQGSMQLQGEVQEIAIEKWLTEQFPLDTIEEVKKGERGADCLQIIHTRTQQNCGTIYYESKRTKKFQPSWIEKFKTDIQDKNANIGVLVTDAMPPDMERLGLRDGVWICSFDEFKSLCTVLRESIIQISTAITTQENKGDKMGMLYDFLTSNEFRLQIEAIVEGFTQMKSDLESEKRAMQGSWKKREKQIEKVILNTTHMYGSVKGIAGSAVQSVPYLELPAGEKK